MKKFMYRGNTLAEMNKMSLEDFAQLLPSKERRHILRGMSEAERKLLKKVRATLRSKGEKKIKTHAREMVVIPEMVRLTIHVYNGSSFIPLEIKAPMIGRRLGEFIPTNKIVKHGMPGVGSTRSSLYVPLK